MKIKNKIRLGFGFLFLVVLFFGASSLYYINEISSNAKVILKNNYETLNYTKEMRTILDEHTLPITNEVIATFNQSLRKQEHNITEPGEKQATHQLKKAFTTLTQSRPNAAAQQQLIQEVRRQLRTIEDLNLHAIVRKNDRARQSVYNATLFLGLIGTFTFILLFSFSVNFPGIISEPLRALLEGIREISQRNYSPRLNFSKDDEFGEVARAFNQMAKRLNEWESSNLAEVLSEKRRIEAIIEQMQDGIIGVNEKQDLLFINDTARTLLGIKATPVVGQLANDLLKGNDLFKSIITATSSNKPFKIVLNGVESFFDLESREITVPHLAGPEAGEGALVASRSAGKVYVLRNITAYREREEAKTNFIATISHELKTPISSIKMSLKLLADERVGAINHEQAELMGQIQEDSDRLLKITSELLDLSQVETGNIQLNFVSVNPLQIAQYASDSVRFQAEQKQVNIELAAAGNLPQVHADVEKTAWVMVNLLSNALRYSHPKSKIIIGIAQRGKMVEFSVRDFGQGIDEQYQKRLFDRYFQVPTDGQNKTGSGLGLAISKDFIEAQNGKIWVQSTIGEGSTFFFTLPVVGSEGK